ncbi:MAG TPA: 50S ribosomal protein L18e [Candidatus Acidoferrum sp.]|nr:50S ribosomal protein L18e [Candidatus Acidoferrum sp.]
MKIHAERNDVIEWLDLLSKGSDSKKTKLWMRVHELLSVPARKRVSVNIYKINKYSKEGDNVIVPGKVLSVGAMDHKINITALEYSKSAMEQLHMAGCKVLALKEMIAQKKVTILK